MPDDGGSNPSQPTARAIAHQERLLEPIQNRVSVGQVARALRCAFAQDSTRRWVVLSALIRATLASDDWRCFATELRPAPTDEVVWREARNLEFGLMRLVSKPVAPADMVSDIDFARLTAILRRLPKYRPPKW
jgi:hypothetical protein